MRISIITPSLNQAAFLPRTLASIHAQQGPFELEHRVIDAGSTDGTLEVLRAIDDPRFSFISEPDDGQSDAINKGFAQTDGDIVAWLNSDDVYEPGALAAVAKAFESHPGAAWVTGPCTIIDQHDQPVRPGVKRYKDRRLRRYSYKALLRENFISQPATFWRRAALQRVGPLDTALNWAMDYDLWLRLGRLSDPVILDEPLARFRLHAAGKTGDFSRRQYDEDLAVAKRYLPASRAAHAWRRLHTEKIVLAYRVMRVIGR